MTVSIGALTTTTPRVMVVIIAIRLIAGGGYIGSGKYAAQPLDFYGKFVFIKEIMQLLEAKRDLSGTDEPNDCCILRDKAIDHKEGEIIRRDCLVDQGKFVGLRLDMLVILRDRFRTNSDPMQLAFELICVSPGAAGVEIGEASPRIA